MQTSWDKNQQNAIDEVLSGHILFETQTCPFCIKVRIEMMRLGMTVRSCNINADPQNRITLVAGGGKSQVPCLKIPMADGVEQWLYESDDIIDYLNQVHPFSDQIK